MQSLGRTHSSNEPQLMFNNLMAGHYPEFEDVRAVFEQLGFNPEKFSSPQTMPKVTQFLNKILSMKVDMQKKHIFTKKPMNIMSNNCVLEIL